MKHYMTFLLLALLLFFSGACSKEDADTASTDSSIVGEWSMRTWNSTPVEDFSVYAVFDAEGRFTLYQRISSNSYEFYTGSYRLEGGVLTGTYDDGTPLAAAYVVEVSAQTLRLTSLGDTQIVSVYGRMEIPADVIVGNVMRSVPPRECVARFL